VLSGGVHSHLPSVEERYSSMVKDIEKISLGASFENVEKDALGNVGR
jgi:hypothetical protein